MAQPFDGEGKSQTEERTRRERPPPVVVPPYKMLRASDEASSNVLPRHLGTLSLLCNVFLSRVSTSCWCDKREERRKINCFAKRCVCTFRIRKTPSALRPRFAAAWCKTATPDGCTLDTARLRLLAPSRRRRRAVRSLFSSRLGCEVRR